MYLAQFYMDLEAVCGKHGLTYKAVDLDKTEGGKGTDIIIRLHTEKDLLRPEREEE